MKNILYVLIFSLPLSLFAAERLPLPRGEVILEVSGAIQHTNVDGQAHFDRAMIEALPSGSIVTSNHILDKAVTYTGPKLEDLLLRLGANSQTIRVTALDEFTALISREDIVKYGVLLATHENSRQLTIDDRGPFFVVFPFDEYEELKND